MIEGTVHATQGKVVDNRPRSFPLGSGPALIGAALMVSGSFGPWVSGQLRGATRGLDLGGDGWLVVACAGVALLPLMLPLPASSLKGVWVIVFAASAGFVCWTHYTEASADAVSVVWGLQIAGIGSGVLGAAGLRLLRPD